jgi:hypothetical protein
VSAAFNTDEDDHAAAGGRFAMLDDGATSFLLAGAVLFASLVLGSAVSLVLAGSDAMVAAIMRGFLSLGLSALAAFLVGTLAAIGYAAIRRSREA